MSLMGPRGVPMRGFLERTFSSSSKRQQDKQQSNIFCSDMVGADYVQGRFQEVAKSPKVTKLEIEDSIACSRHRESVDLVEKLIFAKDREWESIQFVDSFDLDDFDMWHTKKGAMMRDYEGYGVHLPDSALCGVIAWEARVIVPEGTSVEALLKLFKTVKQDKDVVFLEIKSAMGDTLETAEELAGVVDWNDSVGSLGNKIIMELRCSWSTGLLASNKQHNKLLTCCMFVLKNQTQNAADPSENDGQGRPSLVSSGSSRPLMGTGGSPSLNQQQSARDRPGLNRQSSTSTRRSRQLQGRGLSGAPSNRSMSNTSRQGRPSMTATQSCRALIESSLQRKHSSLSLYRSDSDSDSSQEEAILQPRRPRPSLASNVENNSVSRGRQQGRLDLQTATSCRSLNSQEDKIAKMMERNMARKGLLETSSSCSSLMEPSRPGLHAFSAKKRSCSKKSKCDLSADKKTKATGKREGRSSSARSPKNTLSDSSRERTKKRSSSKKSSLRQDSSARKTERKDRSRSARSLVSNSKESPKESTKKRSSSRRSKQGVSVEVSRKSKLKGKSNSARSLRLKLSEGPTGRGVNRASSAKLPKKRGGNNDASKGKEEIIMLAMAKNPRMRIGRSQPSTNCVSKSKSEPKVLHNMQKLARGTQVDLKKVGDSPKAVAGGMNKEEKPEFDWDVATKPSFDWAESSKSTFDGEQSAESDYDWAEASKSSKSGFDRERASDYDWEQAAQPDHNWQSQ